MEEKKNNNQKSRREFLLETIQKGLGASIFIVGGTSYPLKSNADIPKQVTTDTKQETDQDVKSGDLGFGTCKCTCNCTCKIKCTCTCYCPPNLVSDGSVYTRDDARDSGSFPTTLAKNEAKDDLFARSIDYGVYDSNSATKTNTYSAIGYWA